MEAISEPGNEASRESGSACRKWQFLGLALFDDQEVENRRKSLILPTCRRSRGVLGPAEDCSELGTFVDARFGISLLCFLEALLIVYRSNIRWFLNRQIFRSLCISAPNIFSDCVYPPFTSDRRFGRFMRLWRNLELINHAICQLKLTSSVSLDIVAAAYGTNSA